MGGAKFSNYDQMRDQMRGEFLKYHVEPMVKQYGLIQDETDIYIIFVGRQYRVSKVTGRVDRQEEGTWPQADFSESMTIYDVLCYAKEDAFLTHEYVPVSGLKGIVQSATPGMKTFRQRAKGFAGRGLELERACQALGGTPFPVGEVAYVLPLFEFLPVVIQFWDADEEFEAELVLKWDRNIQDFMHFETTFYAAGCLLQWLEEHVKKQIRQKEEML